jgi:hypothetical protein
MVNLALLLCIPIMAPLSAYAQERSYADSLKEHQKQWAVNEKQEAADRLELVIPPSKGFKPKKDAIQLNLRLEKAVVRLGEPLRYKFELVNVSSFPYVFSEWSSFFKSGRLPHDEFMLILKEPDGSTVNVRSPYGATSQLGGTEIQFPDHYSDEQKEAKVAEMGRISKAKQRLYLELAPGEGVHTRGDAPNDPFRTLVSRYELTQKGKYELWMIMGWRHPPTRKSNIVRFTVRD